MAPRCCPIKFEGKCRYCPLPPTKRVIECKYYCGQLSSGVPWWRDKYIWGESEYQKAKMLALKLSNKSLKSWVKIK